MGLSPIFPTVFNKLSGVRVPPEIQNNATYSLIGKVPGFHPGYAVRIRYVAPKQSFTNGLRFIKVLNIVPKTMFVFATIAQWLVLRLAKSDMAVQIRFVAPEINGALVKLAIIVALQATVTSSNLVRSTRHLCTFVNTY